ERLVERLEAGEAAKERARLRDERFRRLVAVRVAERQLGGEEGELRAREREAGGVALRVAGPACEQHGREERGVRVLAVAGRDEVRLEQVVRGLVLAGLVGLGGQALERGEHAPAGARPEQALELLEVEPAQRREEPVAGVESPAEAPGTAVLLVAAQPLGLGAQRVEASERVDGGELGLRGLEPLGPGDGGARRPLERAVGEERDGEAAG